VFGDVSREFTIREAIPCLKHFQNIVCGIVLLSLGLLCRADDYPSNSDCAALRAMTGHEGESAVMLFVVFPQLLNHCGAIHNFECFPKALSLVVVLSFPKAFPLGQVILGFQPVSIVNQTIVGIPLLEVILHNLKSLSFE